MSLPLAPSRLNLETLTSVAALEDCLSEPTPEVVGALWLAFGGKQIFPIQRSGSGIWKQPCR
jgi:hypothetical protein